MVFWYTHYMTPKQKQTTIDTYNKTAQSMADKFNDYGGRRTDIEQTLEHLSQENPKVVELGCGTGRDAAIILEHTADYLGMDASTELLKIAQEYVPTAQFVLADFDNFTFPQQVDAIFAFASLIHADKTIFAEVLKKAHEALTDSGVFFISIKHAPYHEYNKEDGIDRRTYYYYDEPTIHRLIGSDYEILQEKVYELRGQHWYDLILQKRS